MYPLGASAMSHKPFLGAVLLSGCILTLYLGHRRPPRPPPSRRTTIENGRAPISSPRAATKLSTSTGGTTDATADPRVSRIARRRARATATSGSTSDRRSSRSSALCAWRRDLKRDACAIAKDILRGLLHQGRIDRAQFKDAAQCATHRLYERNKYRRVSLTTAMVEAEIERFLWG